ncbi:unnamed protein product [Hanseniaspora opuntiae]
MKEKLIEIGHIAENEGKFNIAFNSYWCAGDIQKISDLLVKTGRVPQAALFNFTYGEDLEKVTDLWRKSLVKDGDSELAERIITPKNANAQQFENNKEEESLIDLQESGDVVTPEENVAENELEDNGNLVEVEEETQQEDSLI